MLNSYMIFSFPLFLCCLPPSNDGPSLPDIGFGAVPIEDTNAVMNTITQLIAEVTVTDNVFCKISPEKCIVVE